MFLEKSQDPRFFRYQSAFENYYRNLGTKDFAVQNKKIRIQLE